MAEAPFDLAHGLVLAGSGGFREQGQGAAQTIPQEGNQVVGAVQVVRQIAHEGIEVRLATVGDAFRLLLGGRRGGGAFLGQAPCGGVHQVHRIDAQATLVGGGFQGRAHGEVFKGLDHADRVVAFQAGHQGAVGHHVALGAVQVDHQEDAAEEVQQFVELVEDLLEEQVVGLDHEDRAGGGVAELLGHAVVAELHAAVETGGVHQDRTGVGQVPSGNLDVHSADGFVKVQGRIELRARVFDAANAVREFRVSPGHLNAQGGGILEDFRVAVVARYRELAVVRVGHIDHARVRGQAGHLAHVGGAHGVHERGLAALQGAEDQDVGLLLRHLVCQYRELIRHVKD